MRDSGEMTIKKRIPVYREGFTASTYKGMKMILNISLAPQITVFPKGAHPSKTPIFLKGETNWVSKVYSTLRPTEHDFEKMSAHRDSRRGS